MLLPQASLTGPIVELCVNVINDTGLWGVFLLMGAGSACIPIPSEAIMLFAGFAVSKGELTLAGITTVEAANAWLRDTYISTHNARFATKAEQEGSAFVAADGLDLAETLCVQEERIVGNDNCVSYENRKLQIPESPLRPHFVKATVKVHQYPNGGLAIFHGRRCLGRYDGKGVQIDVPTTDSGENTRSVPSGREARAVLGTVKDASRRGAVASPKTRPSLTAPPRDAGSRGRSAPGNGPDSLTRKSPPETPLLRRTKQERAAT